MSRNKTRPLLSHYVSGFTFQISDFKFQVQVSSLFSLPHNRLSHFDSMGKLDKQVAWISGAASGMGEGIARLFAREGAAVALADIQAAKGAVVAEKIRAEGGRAIFIEGDVAKEAAVRASL